MSRLFTEYRLGEVTLHNRLVMAPLTRCRAINNLPNTLMAEYYSQRTSAGLIVTEGVAPSPNGLGYARIPGIYSEAQIEAWKPVTDAVHQAGGSIFMQLMHTGRISHSLNMPAGSRVLAPSAVAAAGEMYTDAQGLQPHPVPQAMTKSDIDQTVEEYAQAARNAIKAGFDGVELHAANGYLLEQFLRPNSNQREDEYGGSIENRFRFLSEVTHATLEAIGHSRVGMRLSPFGIFNDMPLYDTLEEDYNFLALHIDALDPLYIHMVDHSAMGAPVVPDSMKQSFRDYFCGTMILSGGYDVASAMEDIETGRADLVALGRPFLANPDLIARWHAGAPLNQPDEATFYTPGAKGYTDYPTLP